MELYRYQETYKHVPGGMLTVTATSRAHLQSCRCCYFSVLLCMLHLAVRQGHIKRVTDEDIQSSVLEISSVNISNTFITCPADPSKTLGIKLPFLVMIVKNQKKYFSFEVCLAVPLSNILLQQRKVHLQQ
jgi:hypothetical protein